MTEAEKAFHRSRLMWAFVGGELYWTYSEDDHRSWLDKTFRKNYKFEDTVRGYIRKDTDTEVVYVVAYRDEFKYVDLSHKQLKLLEWLANLEFTYDKIEIYSGVIPGEPGQVWKPQTLILQIYKSTKTRQVALIDLLTYEKFLVNLLNREDKYLSERRSIEKEYYNLKEWLGKYYNMRVTTSIDVIKRASLYSN